jgi:hypothetical protein
MHSVRRTQLEVEGVRVRRPSVFVPFEVFPDQTEKKCDDLPRFASTREVRGYLHTNGHTLLHRRIEWREHFEKEYIEEHKAGVGTLRILL